MKVYEGKPDGRVVVHEGTKKPRPLDPKQEKVGFAWGKPTREECNKKVREQNPDAPIETINQLTIEEFKRAFINSTRLAIVLLVDVLENEAEAMRYYMRFKDSMERQGVWTREVGWTLSTQEIVAAIVDIKQTYQDTAQSRRMAMQEPTPFVSERGADVVWHKDR